MAMLQTLFMSFVLFVQSLFIPLIHPPSKDPVDYGGGPYAPRVIAAADQLPFLVGGTLNYNIIIPDGSVPPSVMTGVKWLREFLGEIADREPGVFTPSTRPRDGSRCIAVGDTGMDAGALAGDMRQLEDEGFVKRVIGDDVFICGLGRGTMYGCASFLEEELGCRWFTPMLKSYPQEKDIPLDKNMCSIQNPKLEYREDQWGVVNRQPEFMAFHKVNASNSVGFGEEVGYSVRYNPHTGFCHSMHYLIPRDEINRHPEYFSYRKDQGKRTEDQRCLSNPDVLRIIKEVVLEAVRQTNWPGIEIVTVTQDDNDSPCECGDCLALDAKYGGPSGTNIWFTNEVAKAVKAAYPLRNVYIDTFAYGYTLDVPGVGADGSVIAPEENVIVRLCSIDCCFVHPFSQCGHRDEASVFTKFKEKPSRFAQQTKDWEALCAVNGAKLYVWDYTTNFKFYPAIFPNMQVLAPNIQYLLDHGVTGIFEQGNNEGSGINGEFAELRAYLLAKLLWAPETNVEHMIEEFMAAWYGDAAGLMKEYLDTLTRISIDTIHLSIFGRVEANVYFRPSQVRKFDKLFDRAQALTKGSPAHHENVCRTRISLRCYKANYMMCEFSWFNPCRVQNGKQLFHDSIMAGIDAYSQFMAEPYNLYVWLHRPYDWGAMKSWIDFVDLKQVHNMTPEELSAYRLTHAGTWP